MKKAVRKILVVSLLAIIVISFTGCATVFGKSSKDILIISDPPGAEIKINGASYGKTPATIPLKKDSSYLVEISKEGYHSQTAQIRSELGVGWLILDLFSGAVPIVVDAITGDWKKLSPQNVSVSLPQL